MQVVIEERKTLKIVKLTITKSETTDSGVYTVTASNPAGEASATATVKVLTKPDLPTSLRFEEVTADSVKLIWTPPEDTGGKPVKSYIVEKRLANKTLWTKVETTTKTEVTVTKLL